MEIHTIQPFLQYFDNIRERTLRVARCIPPDKMRWTYAPGKFTLGDLLRHLAVAERYMWAETVQGKPSRYASHGEELAGDLPATLELMQQLHTESMAIFAALTDEQLARKCITPGGGEIAAWKWLRAMVEHEVHHRGQIYMYLHVSRNPRCRNSTNLRPDLRRSSRPEHQRSTSHGSASSLPGPQSSTSIRICYFAPRYFRWSDRIAIHATDKLNRRRTKSLARNRRCSPGNPRRRRKSRSPHNHTKLRRQDPPSRRPGNLLEARRRGGSDFP